VESVQAMSTQPIKIEVVHPQYAPKYRPLSKREKQCIQGILEGKKNKEIALNLSITEQMVKNYCRQAFRKLGINDTRQLFVMVIQAQFELRTGQQVPTYAQ
jgi:DNA-binding NarL/FixJ family response regulator